MFSGTFCALSVADLPDDIDHMVDCAGHAALILHGSDTLRIDALKDERQDFEIRLSDLEKTERSEMLSMQSSDLKEFVTEWRVFLCLQGSVYGRKQNKHHAPHSIRASQYCRRILQ